MNPPDGKQPYYKAQPVRDQDARREHSPVTPPQSADASAADDVSLIQRVRAGDQRALAALYDRWASLLYAVAFRFLRDPDEAEDMVEATFWQAWRQADRYEPVRGAVSTWLSMICHSRALERARAIRAFGAERQASLRAEMERAARPRDPARDAEGAERRARIRSALDQLPPEQREAVELAYYRGLSHTEIAEHTGQPLGTIKTRIRLAMQKLKSKLAMLRESSP